MSGIANKRDRKGAGSQRSGIAKERDHKRAGSQRSGIAKKQDRKGAGPQRSGIAKEAGLQRSEIAKEWEQKEAGAQRSGSAKKRDASIHCFLCAISKVPRRGRHSSILGPGGFTYSRSIRYKIIFWGIEINNYIS